MKKLILFASALLFFGVLSCEDPANVGESILPADDALPVESLSFKDFIVNTYKDDTIYTSFRDPLYLGEDFKENFGTGLASIYTELKNSGTFTSVTNPVLDSAVLFLRATAYNGSEDNQQSFKVYALNDSIPSETSFLAERSFPIAQQIGTISNAQFSEDSITVGTVKFPFHLRTQIDNGLGQVILNQLNSGSISSTRDLQRLVKGLAILPEETNTGDGYFTVSAASTSLSGIRLFYKDNEGTQYEYPLTMSPSVDSRSSSNEYLAGVYNHNRIITNYTNQSILNQLDNYSATGQPKGFIDEGNGIYTQLDFPTLKDQFPADARVNSAELVIKPTLNNIADSIHLPNNLNLVEHFMTSSTGAKNGGIITTDGNGLTVRDLTRLYDKSSNGFKSKDNDGNFIYTFYLPNYIEYVRKGEQPSQLYILAPNRANGKQGFEFDATTGIELKINYSKTN